MQRDPDAVRRFQHIRTAREIRRRVAALYEPGRRTPRAGDVIEAVESVKFDDTLRKESEDVLQDWVDGTADYQDVIDSFPTTDPMVRLGRWLRRTLHLK